MDQSAHPHHVAYDLADKRYQDPLKQRWKGAFGPLLMVLSGQVMSTFVGRHENDVVICTLVHLVRRHVSNPGFYGRKVKLILGKLFKYFFQCIQNLGHT